MPYRHPWTCISVRPFRVSLDWFMHCPWNKLLFQEKNPNRNILISSLSLSLSLCANAFYRTNHIDDEKDESLETLLKLTSSQAKQILFGGGSRIKRKESIETSLGRKVPLLSVYVIACTNTAASKIAKLFESIPTRLYRMKPKVLMPSIPDYVLPDRAAALKGFTDKYGKPSLVFDSGTTLSHFIVDKDGKVVEDGAVNGVMLSLQTTIGNTEMLVKDVEKVVSKIIKKGECLSYNADKDTARHKLIKQGLTEKVVYVRWVIKRYLDDFVPKLGPPGPGMSQLPQVGFVGPYADVLARLCGIDRDLTIPSASTSEQAKPRYKGTELTHAVAKGVASTLHAHVEQLKLKPVFEFDPLLLGKRVAKRFLRPDPDNADQYYRGTVTGSKGDGVYTIRYDDNDVYDEDLPDLYGKDAVVMVMMMIWAVALVFLYDCHFLHSVSKHASSHLTLPLPFHQFLTWNDWVVPFLHQQQKYSS